MNGFTIADLAERGFVRGARVAIEESAAKRRQADEFGTVISVTGSKSIVVLWDAGTRGMYSWTALVPLPYVLSEREVRALERDELLRWRAMQRVAVSA